MSDDVAREARALNKADSCSLSCSQAVVVEVQLGYHMSADKQKRYEAIQPHLALNLAAVSPIRSGLKPTRFDGASSA